MSKVYVVLEVDFTDTAIRAIFTSEEKAEKFADHYNNHYVDTRRGLVSNFYSNLDEYDPLLIEYIKDFLTQVSSAYKEPKESYRYFEQLELW